MGVIAVDLGTTNIKVGAYDNHLNMLDLHIRKVEYLIRDGKVEFDAEIYYDLVAKTIRECCSIHNFKTGEHKIVLTGQAESLVVIDKEGKPLRKAISWLDERSKKEVEELQRFFCDEKVYSITGQMSIIPTWPITKILWIRNHEPDVFENAEKYLLLKDYIQYKLTNKILGEFSIYNFSLYFDIHKKCLWQDILDYCQLKSSQFPDLVEPCTNIGSISKKASKELGMSIDTSVNVGTLDHFAAMIGTGNIVPGTINESTGTVLSVATMIDSTISSFPKKVPYHYGPFKDSYVLLSVCESGGISLQWYKDHFLKDVSFDEIEVELNKRKRPGEIQFLPYLTGVNAPDYDEDIRGVFYGLKLRHDEYDLALAVMEGIGHMLAVNINVMNELGYVFNKIISTGGGSRSLIWSHIKADITGYDVEIPAKEEVACFGAAIIGAVDMGIYKSYELAVEKKVAISHYIKSEKTKEYQKSHDLFNQLRYSVISLTD